MWPKKFKKLLDTALDDIEQPAAAILVYAVCTIDDDACGWGGWVNSPTD